MTRWRQHRGMTLLEVMVALLIFALTGSAVMKAASEHLASVADIEEVTFGTWVANNRLNALKLSTRWPPKNNQKGTQKMADRTWYWQQQVVKTNNESLRQVNISVGLDSTYQNTVTTVTTYVSRPATSQSGG